MIQIKDVYKTFDKADALQGLTLNIQEGEIFGLVGTNGSGKTTLLKMICGIYRPDEGSVEIDDVEIYENMDLKENIFYIADDAYFLSGYTCNDMKRFYQTIYSSFDTGKYLRLLMQFGLEKDMKINNLSKGMKKQFSIILGLSANTPYLLLDETFDGLDPVMRQAVKSLLANEICERKVTPIIASHNLRELEDICEHVGLIHKGKVLVSEDMDSLKENLHKVQCVFEGDETPAVFEELDINQCKKQGSLYLLTVRGKREEVLRILEQGNPIFYEIVPLSLEEMFISETEVAGYEIKKKIY
ncbi:MAG: ABC transporter ATP-binding protein [Eubacteriales bacterium]